MAAYDEDLAPRAVEEEESEERRLVFPINVHESLQSSRGLKKGEKVGIIVSFWIVACGLLAWFLAGWLRTVVPQYYLWIVLLIEVTLQLTVGVYILRFALDERSVFAEMNNRDLSFASYFKIYREIISEDGSKYPFDIIEFDDGSYGVFLQCRLGHNTQRRSDATYDVNRTVVDILNKASMPRKVFYHTEMFKNSQAAQDLRDILRGIEDPDLFGPYREIVQNYLRIAEDESNVLAVTYLLYAPTRIAKDDLLANMNNILNTLEADETVFREVSTLQYDEIVEFLRHYYRLEVLDMGLIRATIAQRKSGFNCSVTVLKLYGQSGKIYANDDFKKLNAEVMKEFGLNSIN